MTRPPGGRRGIDLAEGNPVPSLRRPRGTALVPQAYPVVPPTRPARDRAVRYSSVGWNSNRHSDGLGRQTDGLNGPHERIEDRGKSSLREDESVKFQRNSSHSSLLGDG